MANGAEENKSSTGLDANVAALLAYLLGWIGGLIFFLIEKDSLYVKFHAMQSLLLSGAFIVIYIVVWIVTIIFAMISGLLASLVWLFSLVLFFGGIAIWVIMMIKAYQGDPYKLPIIGDMAENIVNK